MPRAVTALLLLALLPAPLPGQLDLTLRWEVVGHAGHAEAPGDDHPTMAPGVGTGLVAAFGFQREGWRGQLGLRRGTADLVLRGEASGIITPAALRETTLTLDLGRTVLGAEGRPTLALLAVISRHRWSFPRHDDPARTRWGGGVALEAAVPVTGRWRAIVRGELASAGSLFVAEELPGGFAPRGARRAGLGVGVRWQATRRR